MRRHERSDRSATRRHLGFSRRDLLCGSAALLATSCLAGSGDGPSIFGLDAAGLADEPESIPEAPLATFPLGVASGDVVTTGAVLWTRYTGGAELHLAVWEMDGDVYLERVGLFRVSPAEGGFVHADVGDLAAGARHRYAFLEVTAGRVAARSPIGRFRSALPDDAVEPMTLAALACTSNGRSMATLERVGERTDLDLLCLLGDTTYNDGARTRDQFRSRWTQNLSTAGYRRARAATSVVATWDDHEISNNWNPETVDANLLTTGTATFFENLPIRRHPTDAGRVYRSLRWGLTAELFVLDCRSERRPSTRLTAGAQYLSRAQMDWLEASLSSSPAVFKIILNSVPITNFPGLFDFTAGDRWEGYPAARREILRFIEDERIDGVVWLAGDFHLGSTGRVSPSGLGRAALEILAGPGAQAGNPLAGTLVGDPQFDFVTARSNYTAVSLDPATRTIGLSFRDGTGAVLGERSYVV